MPRSVVVGLPEVSEEKRVGLSQQLGVMDRLKQAFMNATQMQKQMQGQPGYVPTEKVVGPMFGAGTLKVLPKLAQYVLPEEVAASPKEMAAFIDEAGKILKLKSGTHVSYLNKASTEFAKAPGSSGRRTATALAKEKLIRLRKAFNELNLEHYTDPTIAQRTTGGRIVQAMRAGGEEPGIVHEMGRDPSTFPYSSWPSKVSWPEYLRKVDELYAQSGAK